MSLSNAAVRESRVSGKFIDTPGGTNTSDGCRVGYPYHVNISRNVAYLTCRDESL